MSPSTVQIQGPPPAPEEAAAIAAAIERFSADTAPTARPAAPRRNPWFEAGLLEATGNEADNRFQSLTGL